MGNLTCNDDAADVAQFLPRLQEAKHFHQRLRLMRSARGMSQVDLAKASGINVTQIAHFEAGGRLPAFENLRAITVALRCSSDYLLGLTDGGYEDGYRRGAIDAVEAMKAATMPLRQGFRSAQLKSPQGDDTPAAS